MSDFTADSYAGSAIAMALLDHLVAKEIIGKDEVLAILATAQKSLMGRGVGDAVEAARIVGKLWSKHNV